MPSRSEILALEKFVTFGDLLRYLRRRAGLTQRELAIHVGYSDGQISRLEQNQRLPDLAIIPARFAPALGMEDAPIVLARLMELAAALDREDAPASGAPPFKGLRYFDEADADLFFGREAVVARLLSRLISTPSPTRQTHFLALVGASGSGKSSIVRAGLIPALRWTQASSHWVIHVLTPTARPLMSLAASLVGDGGTVSATAALMDDFSRDSRSLDLYVRRLLDAGPSVAGNGGRSPLPQPSMTANPRFLLVVDQFEELFTLCRDEIERRAFVDNLMLSSAGADSSFSVIVALRADFYGQCAPYDRLREALAGEQEYIGPMNADELRRAVEEPIKPGGWELEPGLVEVLLENVLGEPGALPLLSHALLETWHRRRGRTLTLSGYLASGGVRGAIAETAEAVFHDQLTHEQQAIARNIFVRLTELGESDAVADTRRRVAFNELIPKPEDAAAVRATLTILADARLITTEKDTAEVAHEALIREWPTLRTWLEDNRDGLRLQRHLTESALEWERRQRDPGELYRGARLAQALEWAASSRQAEMLNESERAFLRTSKESAERDEDEREAQRQRELAALQRMAAAEGARAEEQARSANRLRARSRLISAVGGVALLLAILAGVFGIQASLNAGEAQKNLVTARSNYAHAESLRLAAEAGALLTENASPETAVLLSIRALRDAYTPQADASLVRALTGLYTRQQFIGHTMWVYGVAFAPDGKHVLTGSLDSTARLWDSSTGQQTRVFRGHTGGVIAVAISPDGRYALTGSNDKTARLWEASTGQEVRTFVGHTDGLTAVAFSPDGKQVLTGSGDRTARLWDVMGGQTLQVFEGHSKLVSAVAFSPDGKTVLSGSYDGTARLWDVATGRELREFTAPPTAGLVTSVAFSPDGESILTGSSDRMAELWDVATGQEVRQFAGHTDSLTSVAFSADGKYVLTASEDGTARLWETATGHALRVFTGHTGGVRGAAFSPNGYQVVTASEDKTARLWDAGIGPAFRVLSAGTGGVSSVAFSPDGRYAIVGEGLSADLWDVGTQQEVRSFSGHTKDVISVAFSPDGKYLLTGSDDQTARLWDVATGRVLHILPGHIGGATSVAFSPDSKFALTTCPGGSSELAGLTRLWDVGTGQLIRTFEIGAAQYIGIVSVLAFSPDGKAFLTVDVNSPVALWDPQADRELRAFIGHTQFVRSLAFSPDGRYVLTGSYDYTARLWDASTGKELRVFTDNSSEVFSVAFSPDSKTVLTGHGDNVARAWDVTTGRELRQFTGHAGIVDSVAFSPDGKYVLTGSEDGTARLWDSSSADTIRVACSMLLRDLTSDERAQYAITDNTSTCP